MFKVGDSVIVTGHLGETGSNKLIGREFRISYKIDQGYNEPSYFVPFGKRDDGSNAYVWFFERNLRPNLKELSNYDID